MYRITLPINIDGTRYGITFFKGIGDTADKKIALRMEEKGFTVEELAERGVASVPEPTTDFDSLTDEELAEIAVGKGIDVEGKSKKQVVSALKKAV